MNVNQSTIRQMLLDIGVGCYRKNNTSALDEQVHHCCVLYIVQLHIMQTDIDDSIVQALQIIWCRPLNQLHT